MIRCWTKNWNKVSFGKDVTIKQGLFLRLRSGEPLKIESVRFHSSTATVNCVSSRGVKIMSRDPMKSMSEISLLLENVIFFGILFLAKFYFIFYYKILSSLSYIFFKMKLPVEWVVSFWKNFSRIKLKLQKHFLIGYHLP